MSHLTRRDMFAMAAMQGLLANVDTSESPSRVSQAAVRYADALIAELDRTAVAKEAE